MKKTIAVSLVLILLLSGCAKSSKNPSEYMNDIEKDALETFNKVADDNNARVFLTFQVVGDDVELINDYMNEMVYEDTYYLWSSTYMMYDEDGNKLMYIKISEFEDEFEEGFLFDSACIIDNSTIEYSIYDDIDEDDVDDEVEDMCDDLGGEFHGKSSSSYEYEDDDYYYDDEDEDEEDDDSEFKY